MSDRPVYVVLGASGAIGSEVCRQLYVNECNLIMCARHVEKLDTLQAELPDTIYHHFEGDAMVDVERCVQQGINMYGKVDAVLNCVGELNLKSAAQTDEDEWRSMVDLVLSTSFAIVRKAGELMLADGGSLVFISSEFARTPVPNTEAFAAATAGVAALVKTAAKTFAPFSIRVNAVAPGLVKTKAAEPYLSKVPAGINVHEAGDVAKVMTWLANPATTETGQVLGIDEGLAKVG